MAIKRGVSFYSYQQSQFFKQLDLEAQIREVGENLDGADGIEMLDEMSRSGTPTRRRSFSRNGTTGWSATRWSRTPWTCSGTSCSSATM
jgi:hypothetical protein